MPDDKKNSYLSAKRLGDIKDHLKLKDRQRELLKTIRQSINSFNDAYRTRRERLLELNAIYRNQSYYDKNKTAWQTKMFLPLPYKAVEDRTSVLLQGLWGNRLSAPYTAIGRTPEDHDFALSAELMLNNTMDRIGFYAVSEEGIRSTVKYGLGIYRYGWVRRNEERLWREVIKPVDKKQRPQYKYVKKTYKINQPFVRAVDIIDHMGWDPTTKNFEKWACSYVYEIVPMTKEEIYEEEVRGQFDEGTFDSLKKVDPHGINEIAFNSDRKEPEIRRVDGVESNAFVRPIQDKYEVIHWQGWFDVDGDGLREFITADVILDNSTANSDQILRAEENLMGEYNYVDIQYSRSLHSLTPWGILDPVVQLSYQMNELYNQRGDSIKLKLNPQFIINVDKILEDHTYISAPGAFHPVATGDEQAGNAIQVLQFQNLEFISTTEEERLVNFWREVTGTINVQQAIGSLDRTPATTLISLLNEQQATGSMIINGILDRHAILGSRIFKQIQLFGDDEFILRTAGRRGIEFRRESIQNILGEFDIKVTTSTFFGNKEVELQQLIQLRPLWINAPHINLEEVDRAILLNILPKWIDKIIRIPGEPLSIIDEQALFLAGQGESVEVSEEEDLASLKLKLRAHEAFERTGIFNTKEMEYIDKTEFDRHLERIRIRIEDLEAQRLLQQQQAAEVQQQLQGGPQGNLGNTGSPNIRTVRNQGRPNVPPAALGGIT